MTRTVTRAEALTLTITLTLTLTSQHSCARQVEAQVNQAWVVLLVGQVDHLCKLEAAAPLPASWASRGTARAAPDPLQSEGDLQPVLASRPLGGPARQHRPRSAQGGDHWVALLLGPIFGVAARAILACAAPHVPGASRRLWSAAIGGAAGSKKKQPAAETPEAVTACTTRPTRSTRVCLLHSAIWRHRGALAFWKVRRG